MSGARNTGVAFSVAAAALGYFVDLYDIVIFGVVRVASLNDLGITGADNTSWGIHLLNLQMIGMLIGGVLWGVLGDTLGRRTALLATIGMYSLANVANGFVTSVEQYAVLRFVAGIGLAGELGMGVTLVAELMPAKYRGYGTTVISFLGLLGALAASYVGVLLPWRMAFIAGGVMGFAVMAARWYGLRESEMFTASRAQAQHQGDLRVLLRSAATLRKFLAVIAVGVPIWYVSALFVNLAPEYGKALNLAEPLTVAQVLRWQAIGLAIGSAVTGLLSEWLGSRKQVLYGCFALLLALVAVLLGLDGASVATYCAVMFAIGLGQGYWTVFMTTAAEQFGTNIRATVATSVPNFVRAMIVPITLGLTAIWDTTGLIGGTVLIGAIVFGVALLALWTLQETWGRDLDYRER
jgi:MFS transporter, putative metabolite:H+ symporter